MKWQLLLVGLLLMGCVASVGAVRENFQSWGSTDISATSSWGLGPSISLPDSTTGDICLYVGYGSYSTMTVYNTKAVSFDYAAFDLVNPGTTAYSLRIRLLDSSGNIECSKTF